MSSLFLRASTVAFLVLSACSSDSDADSTPPPAPESLFETLPTASPNKLRGVYMTSADEPGGTVEIRVRFVEKYVVGAAKCTFKGGASEPIVAGASVSVPLGAAELEAASGKFTMSLLDIEKKNDIALCKAGLQGATYDFKVDEDKLTLTVAGSLGALLFKKIGD